MFYDGTLQSGIAQALQESKPVACFVRDNSEESTAWEHSFLGHHDISSLLASRAVTLRIQSGSQEAGYLAAYFPISVSPSLIIINNGQLVVHLHAGIEFGQFRDAILQALSQPEAHKAEKGQHEPSSNDDEGLASQSSSLPQKYPHSIGTDNPNANVTDSPGTSNPTPPRSSTPPMETVASAPTTSNLQQVMEDRRRRLEADKAAKDAAEKSKRKAIAQARREKANAAPGTPVSNQSLYAQEQRKRKQEAREERERILKVIENDKAERKEKEAQRRALAKAEATDTAKEADVGEASESTGPGLVPNWGGTSHPRQCALQVRLFDGTTIRGKFQSDQTLGAAVRTWIAEQRTDGDTPFTLKQILTPLPNRTITISEEEESLQTLGLLPSATMVMVPIQGYIGAYTNDQGIIGKAVSVGYNAASTGGNLLKGALGTVFGFGQAAPNTQGASTDEQHRNNSDKEHQLYNGNQLNFEPRRDKDDDQ